MCSFIVLMPLVWISNVDKMKNIMKIKKKTLNEKVCPNFWLVVYVYSFYIGEESLLSINLPLINKGLKSSLIFLCFD